MLTQIGLKIIDEIERAGEQSYLAGESYNNPYAINCDEFNRYERGWTQAQKKSEVGLLPKPKGIQKTEFPLLFSKTDKEPVYCPPTPRSTDEDAANKYRNRKG